MDDAARPRSPVPLSRQLAAALREASAKGGSTPAPGCPRVAPWPAELGLARSTIVGVFEQLAAEGYIAGKPGSGYFAAVPLGETIPQLRTEPSGAASAIAPRRTAARLPCTVATDAASVRIGLRRGRYRLYRDVEAARFAGFVRRSSIAWNYGDPQGEPKLRRAIADYLAAARGVRCRPEQIVLTSGTQQGLSLAVQMLIDPGAAAWVEDPCYRATIDILRAAEHRSCRSRSTTRARHRRRRAPPWRAAPPRLHDPVAAIPARHGDAVAARIALLNWAAQNGVWIVEDDYESEFQAPGRMLPSLQGLDRAGRVIYLGTFSKLLFPSLRLGYAVLPEDLVAPFAGARHLADRQSSALIQAIMTEFMLDGHFARHLKRMRARYAERQRFLDRTIDAPAWRHHRIESG
jgi:GntR family transcriptional regulator/MocR family aminotransferase